MKSISNFCFISLSFDSFQEERGRKFFYPDNNKFNRSAFSSAKIQRIAGKMRFNFVLLKFDVVDFSSCSNHTRNGKSIIVMYMFHMDICCTACPDPQTLWINLLAFKFFFASQFIPLIPCVCVCFFRYLYYLWILCTVTSFYCLQPLAPLKYRTRNERTLLIEVLSFVCPFCVRYRWWFDVSVFIQCANPTTRLEIGLSMPLWRCRRFYRLWLIFFYCHTFCCWFFSSAPFNNNNKNEYFFLLISWEMEKNLILILCKGVASFTIFIFYFFAVSAFVLPTIHLASFFWETKFMVFSVRQNTHTTHNGTF